MISGLLRTIISWFAQKASLFIFRHHKKTEPGRKTKPGFRSIYVIFIWRIVLCSKLPVYLIVYRNGFAWAVHIGEFLHLRSSFAYGTQVNLARFLFE